jgi:hypothetical protein
MGSGRGKSRRIQSGRSSAHEPSNGKSVNADGSVEWWKDGLRHREDGPAYEGADGTKDWWVDGQAIGQAALLAAHKAKQKAAREDQLVSRLQEVGLRTPSKVTF